MAVHVAITRTIKPGCERAFEDSLRRFFKTSLDHPGVMGVHLLSPPPGSTGGEYGILRTFADAHERDAFYGSDVFADWQKQVAHLTNGDCTYRQLQGLEAWFRSAPAPARWKLAIVTWLGVWPTSALVGALLGAPLAGVPQALGSGLIAAVIVVCLTWIVMPLLVRLFRFWLR